MNQSMTKGILTVVVCLTAATVPASPARGHGSGSKSCLVPNGVDDTEALQAALDRCAGAERRCVVRLCEGVFLTRPVRVLDFRGQLRGAGRNRTVIRALPNLEVNSNPDGYVFDDPFDPALAPWPFLLQFVEGKGTIRDLAVEVPAAEDPEQRPTQGWLGGFIHEMAGAILITGRFPVDYFVERVRIAGAHDPASFLGTTLLAGVHFQGALFNPDDAGAYPVFPVQGRLKVTQSELEGMLSGTPLGELGHASVSFSRNVYRSGFVTDVLDATHSHVRIAGNRFETTFRAVQVYLNLDGAPSQENTFMAIGNRGSVGPGGDGFVFEDPFFAGQEPGNSRVVLAYNRFELGDETGPAASGTGIVGAGSVVIGGNRLLGRAGAGIRADETTGCWIFDNSLSALDTAGGPHVELGPGTSDCRVLVDRDDIVRDDGTDNRITRR